MKKPKAYVLNPRAIGTQRFMGLQGCVEVHLEGKNEDAILCFESVPEFESFAESLYRRSIWLDAEDFYARKRTKNDDTRTESNSSN